MIVYQSVVGKKKDMYLSLKHKQLDPQIFNIYGPSKNLSSNIRCISQSRKQNPAPATKKLTLPQLSERNTHTNYTSQKSKTQIKGALHQKVRDNSTTQQAELDKQLERIGINSVTQPNRKTEIIYAGSSVIDQGMRRSFGQK